MTKDELKDCIGKAYEVYHEKRRKEKEALEAEYSTYGDKAKVYIDQLFEEIEKGSNNGVLEYYINDLNEDDFEGASVKLYTLTRKICDILRDYEIDYMVVGNSLKIRL